MIAEMERTCESRIEMSRVKKHESTEEPTCTTCGGMMACLGWQLYYCLPCHKRRTERNAQAGRALLEKLEITDSRENSDENPL
jgi:tRNA(Ile2) C34 agmatinyltransferase TiaS